MDIADLKIDSMTQSPEDIQKVLGDEYETEVQAGAPEAASPEIPATPETPATPGAEATPATPAPPAEPDTHERRPSGYKAKWERANQLLADKDREIEELRKQIPGRSAASMLPAEPSEPATPPAPPPAAAAPAAPAAAASPAAAAAPAPAVVEFAKPKPKPEDFEYGASDPAYVEAVSDWNYDRREHQRKEEERVQTERAEQQRQTDETRRQTEAAQKDQRALDENFKTSWETAKAHHADFDEKMAVPHPKPIWNGVMYAAVKLLPNPGELAYWLATHPEEANQIHELTYISDPSAPKSVLDRKFAVAIGELSKIDVTSEAAAASPAEPAPAAPALAVESAAPAPARPAPPARPETFTPVGSRGSAHSKPVESMDAKDLRNLPPDEYRRRRGINQ